MPTTAHPTAEQPIGSTVGTVARSVGALALVVSGLVHIQLYFDGYRDFPLDANLGRSFILQGIVSTAVAAALVISSHVGFRLAGVVTLAGTLGAFALSRTDRGIFQFSERGLQPSPQALLSIVAAIVGLAALAPTTFVRQVGAGRTLDARPAAAGSFAIALVAVVGATLWARTDAADELAGPASEAPAAPTSTAQPTTVASIPAATSTPQTSMPEMSMPNAPTATVAATAPGTEAAPADTTAPAEAGVTDVRIVEFAFDAPTLEVRIGTTVRWTNDDSFAHSVVADDGSFESDAMDTGDTFEFTFETAGDFTYICGIHPSMVGAITVTA